MPKLGITSSIQLLQLSRELHIPHLQIYSIDKIPKKLSNQTIAIINSDVSTGNGTHWTCLYSGSKQEYTIIIDPFGVTPDDRILKWAQTGKKKVVGLDDDFQNFTASSCGWWCLWFLYELHNGIKISDLITQCKHSTLDNERRLQKFFEKVI